MDYNKKFEERKDNYANEAYHKYEEKKLISYELAFQEELLNDQMFYNDISSLTHYLSEWKEKTPSEEYKEILAKLLQAVFRIDIHKEHYKKIAKKAMADLIEQKSIANRYADRCIELEKENDILRKEIKFHEGGK
jgi:hypothetical protein